jgi:hypothetical protein
VSPHGPPPTIRTDVTFGIAAIKEASLDSANGASQPSGTVVRLAPTFTFQTKLGKLTDLVKGFD